MVSRSKESGKVHLAAKSAGTIRRPLQPAKPTLKTAVPSLDPIIHERARLGMVTALARNDFLSFNDLKRVLNVTDGNLSVHARKLEEAGYVRCRKFFLGRIPRSEYRLTPAGRRALEEYLNHMQRICELVEAPGSPRDK